MCIECCIVLLRVGHHHHSSPPIWFLLQVRLAQGHNCLPAAQYSAHVGEGAGFIGSTISQLYSTVYGKVFHLHTQYSELGTWQHCRDNLTIFFRPKIVYYCFVWLFHLENVALHFSYFFFSQMPYYSTLSHKNGRLPSSDSITLLQFVITLIMPHIFSISAVLFTFVWNQKGNETVKSFCLKRWMTRSFKWPCHEIFCHFFHEWNPPGPLINRLNWCWWKICFHGDK